MTDLAYADEPVTSIPGFLNCEPVPPFALINLAREYVQEHTLTKRKPLDKLRRDAKRVGQTVNTLSQLVPLHADLTQAVTRNTGREYWALRQAQGVTSSSARRELTVLRTIMGHAKREGRIDSVPAIWVPDPSPARLMFLTPEQYAALMRLPMTRRTRLFWLLAFGTGARSEAIEELTWQRVDFARRTADYRVEGAVYKNKRRVVAPLNSRLVERLRNFYEIRDPSDPLVIGRGKPRKNAQATTYHECSRCIKALGIYKPGMARHVARHTFVTWLLQARVSTDRVAELIGDDPKMIRQVYGHLAPEDLMDDTERVLRVLERATA